MTGPAFVTATRQATRLRIGLESPSGAGKTWTALKLATELAAHDGGRVALIDSERGSASKYSGGRPYDFDICVLDDRAPEAYIAAMRTAAAAQYPVIVVDSASHEWKGVLALVDSAASRMQGNTWAGWSRGRPAHDAFVDEMLSVRAHVIATFRSKQETEQYKEGNATKVRKLGLAPVTADDMDYEFDVWGSISHDEHTVIVAKSRIDTIPVGSEWPGGDGLVEAYLAWVDGAEYAEPPPVPVRKAPAAPQGQRQQQHRNGTARRTGDVSDLTSLMNWALQAHGMSRDQVVEAVGCPLTEITDFAAAKQQIEAKLGAPAPVAAE